MPDILTAIVTGARQLSPHVRELTLAPSSDPVSFVPGQWLSLRLPVGERPPLIRAYSLAAAPAHDDSLTICFDRVEGGLGSEYLWTIEPGAALEFSGPLGNFVLPETTEDLVFMARYTGIVPFRAMLQQINEDKGFYASRRRVHLLYEADNLDELVYHREIAALAMRTPWLDYRPCVTGQEAPPFTGIGQFMDVMDALKVSAAEKMPFTPMICGVREFTFPIRAFLMETLGFDRRQVKVENYNGPTART